MTRLAFRRAVPVLLVLAAGHPPLAAQDFSDLTIETVSANHHRFLEGPAWSKDGFLLFSDGPLGQILKWAPEAKVEVYREESRGAAGNAFDGQGRLYTCETHARRVTRTDKSGKLEVLAERFEGKRLNAPNDLALSRGGHVYFTDPAFGSQADSAELGFYGVYHLPPKGPLKLVAKPEGRPNGIALSPNGRVLYVTNSDEHNLRAYDLDKDGEASNERILISGIAGVPGGVRTDEKGNLYVAADKVQIYDPEGRPLHSIELHTKPSNCAFGDADLKSLFITGRDTLYRVRLDVKGSVPY